MARECWAASLGGCNRISREHVVSESVLNAVFEYDERMTLSMVREGAQPRQTSIANMTVRNLCRYHNGKLGDLDDEAARFAKAVLRAMTPAHAANVIERRAEPVYECFDGVLLERWALKTFLNVCAARDNSDAFLAKNWAPLGGATLAEIVFNGTPLPDGQGVFFLEKPEPRVHGSQRQSPFDAQVATFSRERPHLIFLNVTEPELRCPMFMIVSIGPMQFAVCANITNLAHIEWSKCLDEFTRSGGVPRGYFHTPMILLEWRDERAISNTFLGEHVRPWGSENLLSGSETNVSRVEGTVILAANLNWRHSARSLPASIVLNQWIGYKSPSDGTMST